MFGGRARREPYISSKLVNLIHFFTFPSVNSRIRYLIFLKINMAILFIDCCIFYFNIKTGNCFETGLIKCIHTRIPNCFGNKNQFIFKRNQISENRTNTCSYTVLSLLKMSKFLRLLRTSSVTWLYLNIT